MSKRIICVGEADSENGHDLSSVRQLSRKSASLFGPSNNGNTWKEALEREKQAISRNDPVPIHVEVRYVTNKAVFFKDEKYAVHRWLQFLSVPILNIITWEVAAANWTINLGYSVFYSIGIGIVMLSNFAWWYTIYCEDGIRKDKEGNPGIGVRAFRLLDPIEIKAMASWRSWFSISSLICVVPCLSTRIIYFTMIWSELPPWGQAIEITSFACNFFFHGSVGAIIFVFMSTMEASTRLIRKEQIFVLENDFEGNIDWEATQRNFDTLEGTLSKVIHSTTHLLSHTPLYINQLTLNDTLTILLLSTSVLLFSAGRVHFGFVQSMVHVLFWWINFLSLGYGHDDIGCNYRCIKLGKSWSSTIIKNSHALVRGILYLQHFGIHYVLFLWCL